MKLFANYRNGMTQKIPAIKFKLLILVTFLSVLMSQQGLSQVTETFDSLRVDSLNNNVIILNNEDSTVSVQSGIIGFDSIVTPTIKSKKKPGRAALFSAILPGLGQTYNGNYWKVPIIYTSFMGLYFLGEENNYKYHVFKEAILAFQDTLASTVVDPKLKDYTEEQLIDRKDFYKRNRNFNIIVGVLIYVANILDAAVDAHLMDYDINPDLSLKVQPEVNNLFVGQNNYYKSSFGIKFVFSLH